MELGYVPDHLKTQAMCEKAFENDSYTLKYVPDHLKTQEVCNKTLHERLWLLEYVPDWFVTQKQIDIWCDDDYWYHDDEIIKWCNGYKKRKAQKAKIKEELMPISWHPDRAIDWCMSEDEKGWWDFNR